MHYVYDALATFAFTPAITTSRGAHIRDGVDLKRTMFIVVMALIPALIFGMYNTGHWHFVAESGNWNLPYWEQMLDKFLYGAIKVLPMIVVSYGVGLGVEFIFCNIKGHPIHEGFLVSGMLIPLVMPVEVPLWMVAVATAFAVLIGKEVFGGTGMNIVNIALTARAFLFFAYPTKMSGDTVWMGGKEADGFSGATFLGDAQSLISDSPTVEGVSGIMDKYSFMDSFLGMIPGSIGETSLLDMYKVLDVDPEAYEDLKGDAESVAGFIIEQSGRIMRKNERLTVSDLTFIVEAADKKRVKLVRVIKNGTKHEK